jgi:hypothetical protein
MPGLDPGIHRKGKRPGESPAFGHELDFVCEIHLHVRIMKRPLNWLLGAIFILSVAALFLAHEDPFVREALCTRIAFCPVISNAKAWNKIFYDLAAGLG